MITPPFPSIFHSCSFYCQQSGVEVTKGKPIGWWKLSHTSFLTLCLGLLIIWEPERQPPLFLFIWDNLRLPETIKSYLFTHWKSPGPSANTHTLQSLKSHQKLSCRYEPHLTTTKKTHSELTKLLFRPRFKASCGDWDVHSAVLAKRAI